MRIINDKKFYKKQEEAAVRIDGGGWNYYSGSNWQWYRLFYNPECGYVRLECDNSGDCFGNYDNYYFDSPKAFLEWCSYCDRSWQELLGNIDESNSAAIAFVKEV